MFFFILFQYQTSPLIHLASWMSFGIIVTHLACKAHRFDCSSKPIRKVSPASCRAITAVDCNHKSSLIPCMISLMDFWNGNLQTSNSVPLWYFLISFNAFLSSPHSLYFFLFHLICLLFPSPSLLLHFLPLYFLCPPPILLPNLLSLCARWCFFHFACHFW